MAPEGSVQRRVLVAVSSSRNSKDALAWTLEKLVTNEDDILMLLHVLKPVQYVSTPDGYKDVSQVDQVIVQKIGLEARRVGGELLESFEDLCAPKRVEPLTKLVEGDRRKVILEEIDRMGATDLVMGGKARRIMPKLKSTNLIDYCLKHARCAVFIIRKGQVIQSAPAKPALIKPPTEPAPPEGPVSDITNESTAAAPVKPLPAGPEVAALTESDRARWRSVADNPDPEDGSKGSIGGQTSTSVTEAAPGGAENGREITPGEVDTGSEFMARYIVKVRAEELTLALEKLESDGSPNILMGDQLPEGPSEKEVPVREGAAADQAPHSKTTALSSGDLAKDASAVCKNPSLKEDLPATSPPPKSGPPTENPSPKRGPAKQPSPKRNPPAKNPSPKRDPPAKNPSPKRNGSPRASQVAAKAGKGRKGSRGSAFEIKQIEQALASSSTGADVAAVGGDRPAGSPAVSDKEVDPNSLSLNEVHVEEVKSPTKPTDDRFDSETSLLEHENSFGAFKSQSSTDQELLNMMTVAKKDPVEKTGEVNGFIQYKRPETPEFTRGLEVLEILDRWLLARHELASRSQTEESFLSEPAQINGREAPARSSAEAKNKRAGRFSRLFRGRGKKEEPVKKAAATAGAVEATAGTAQMTPGTEEMDRAVEEFWEESPPAMLPDGGADEPGLLSRIADVIIAEEEEKARRSDVIEGPAPVPDRSSVNLDVRSALTDEVLDRTGSGELGCETDRAGSAHENTRRMLEEENAEGQSPQISPAKSAFPEPKVVTPGLKVVIPEGQPPAKGRVKVKVQMLHTEARESTPANSPRPAGVSRRVSRALLEGMVPELPREEPEERPGQGASRPSIAPPQQGPPPDPNAPDKYRQELSKYTLEGWLGIGQCVTRFLEDDRSSISSEAYESLGGSLDTGTPVSCSWEGEPADVAAVQHQHVAGDWGYGSSRLGAQPEEAAGLRGVPAVVNRPQWMSPAVQNQSAGVPDAQVAEFMKAVSEAREQVSEQRPGSESEAPQVASTSGAAHVEYDARRDKKLRSPFSSYWTPEAATSAPDESQALSSAPKFGGIALRTDSRPSTPETLAARPPSARAASPEAPVSSRRRKSERKSERDAYDPRKWAIPLQREEETRVLRRHPSEVELFGEEEEQEVFRAPVCPEAELSADSLSALTISQAITDLAASAFADLVSDGRISSAQVAQWRDEIAWLTSPGDQVTELVASTVETKTGSMRDIVIQRPRADVQTSLPALRALDDLLQRIVLRMNAGKAATKRELMGTREQTVQVLKAALMINEEVLHEITVPNAYWATLPKTIKQVLGSDTFNALTSKAVNPAHLLMVVNPKTPEHAWRTVNNLEAAIHMWRSMMVDLAEPLAKKRATYASRASALVHDLKMTWPSLEATELAEFKITRNTDVGRAILESYSRALISLCGKTITCLDYLLTLEPPAEKSGKRPRSTRPTSAKPSPPTSPPEVTNTTGQPLPSPTGSISPNGLGNGLTPAATPKVETPGKMRRFLTMSLRGKKSPRS